MAGVAFSFAVEIRLTCLGVASDYVLNLIGASVGGQIDLQVEEFREVAELVVGEGGKRRHAFVWEAFANYRANYFALVVVENDRRAQEIGTDTAAGVGSMTKCARRAEDLGALGGSLGI